ncbi:MAG: hypothetical protein ACI4RR_05355 [Eubacterium sp.]
MLWSIINEADVFYCQSLSNVGSAQIRSSNPYDYIRNGYYLDNASMFGGKDSVSFNSNISGNRTGSDLGSAGV